MSSTMKHFQLLRARSGSAPSNYGMIALAAGVLAAGCHNQTAPAQPADTFLKDTVAKYGAAKSFKTSLSWVAALPEGNLSEDRIFAYEAPNKYSLSTKHDSSYLEVSVSDGAQITEYDNDPSAMPLIDSPPDSLAAAQTPQMKSVTAGADPLYAFLSGKYDQVSDPKGAAPHYGPDVELDGASCHTVVYASPKFGNVEAAIGVKDHAIRRLKYDGRALLGKNKPLEDFAFESHLPKPPPATLPIVEAFHASEFETSLPEETFETRLPSEIPAMRRPGAPGNEKTASAQDSDSAGDGDEGEGGLPVGSAAPDVSVVDVRTGAKIHLSQFRGQPVLLDFWATWCPPCRMSLPDTERFSKKFGPAGLHVLAISNEDKGTIMDFVHANKYTFPAYRDAGLAASQAYHVSGIPAVFVIDKEGKIAHYQVGYGGPEPLEAALGEVGFHS